MQLKYAYNKYGQIFKLPSFWVPGGSDPIQDIDKKTNTIRCLMNTRLPEAETKCGEKVEHKYGPQAAPDQQSASHTEGSADTRRPSNDFSGLTYKFGDPMNPAPPVKQYVDPNELHNPDFAPQPYWPSEM